MFNHRPALEIIDDESNIRAFLISFGIPLSGKVETNRANLIQAARNHNPPLDLYWVSKKGEYQLHIDEVEAEPKGKKKNKKAKSS